MDHVHARIAADLVMKTFHLAMVLLVTWLASACATLRVEPLPEPIREPKALPDAAGTEEGTPSSDDVSGDGPRSTRAPGVVIQRTVAESAADRLGEELVGDPVRVSFHDVPLVPFINEVFGEELGMSFVISPGLRDRTDLVTLKLTEPLPPRQLFAAARQVLREYGVDLRETEAGILTFAPGEGTGASDVPLLVSGRALPEVPATHRTVFQLVPIKVVRGPQVRGWLIEAFGGRDLKIFEDPERNALLLKGNADMVAQALSMIEVLDQPLLRGRHSVVIEPVFMEAGALAAALDSILDAEGYAASLGTAPVSSVVVIGLESVNKVVAFAADRRTIGHVTEWARILDTRQKESVDEGVFTYEVRNTQAGELTGTLNRMLGLGAARLSEPDGNREGGAPEARPAGDRIVVDKNRNMLLFRGSGKEWAEIRSVVEKLDKAVPSVLIEVLIAEISLTDEENTGLEFLLRGGLGSRALRIGTGGEAFGGTGGLDLGQGGLGVTLNSGSDRRVALNLFYRDDRVVLRSRPRLLVKSGETASIEVGNQIPVITQRSESDTQTDGSTDILQQITYRKTGVQLEIKPVVQANGLVDIRISQQLSEARRTSAGEVSQTPTILNRQISTSLTLRDGGSFLMGGLISGNQSAGQRGVPVLGRLPGIGALFRTDSLQEDRTELVVMVTPYVIADHEEGRELTRRIAEQLDLHTDMLK